MKDKILLGDSINIENRKILMLDILKYFISYCDIHGLKYYLIGGTLLGAVRHKGFIPWDDDIDVCMPIDDYNRLIKLSKQEAISERYYLSTFDYNYCHLWPMLKLFDSRTYLVEPVLRKKYLKEQAKFGGVYIDIFPLYGLPNESTDRERFQRKLRSLYEKHIRATRVMNRREQDSFLTYRIRCILYWIYCLPFKIIGSRYYLSRIIKMSNKYPLGTSEHFGFALGLTENCVDNNRTELLKEHKKLYFETLTCNVLAGYHEILTRQYGDYMILPQVEKRRFHPSETFWRVKRANYRGGGVK